MGKFVYRLNPYLPGWLWIYRAPVGVGEAYWTSLLPLYISRTPTASADIQCTSPLYAYFRMSPFRKTSAPGSWPCCLQLENESTFWPCFVLFQVAMVQNPLLHNMI